MSDPDPAGSPSSRAGWTRWVLPVLLLVALGVRVAALIERHGQPGMAGPVAEAAYYQYWAEALGTGNWRPPVGRPDPEIPGHPVLRPPGYAWLMSLVVRVAGPGTVPLQVAQVGLGLVSLVLMARLGRRLGGEVVGWLAAGFLALSWQALLFEQETVPASLSLLLLLVLLLLALRFADRPGLVGAVLTGAATGLACLVDPSFVALLPVVLGWLAWTGRGQTRLVPALGLALAAFLAGTAPALVRNLQAGEAVWLSAERGINLYLASNPAANGMDPRLPGNPSWSPFAYPALVADLGSEEGRSLGYREASSVLAGRARAFWRDQPGDATALALNRARWFWAANEPGYGGGVSALRQQSVLLRNLPFPFAFLAAAAVVGALLMLADGRSRRPVVLVLAVTGAWWAAHVPHLAASDARHPVLPLLFALGACAVTGIDRRYQNDGLRGAGLWLVLLLGLWGAGSFNLAPNAARAGQRWVEQGIEEIRRGDWEAARDAFFTAVEQNPRDPVAQYQYGNALLREGRNEEADAAFAAALAIVPDYLPARIGQGKILAQGGDFAGAAAIFEAAVDADPSVVEGWLLLGAARQAQGRIQEAVWSYQKAAALAPDLPEPLVGLGYAALSQRQLDDAERWFRQALSVAPGHPEADAGLLRVQASRRNRSR